MFSETVYEYFDTQIYIVCLQIEGHNDSNNTYPPPHPSRHRPKS